MLVIESGPQKPWSQHKWLYIYIFLNYIYIYYNTLGSYFLGIVFFGQPWNQDVVDISDDDGEGPNVRPMGDSAETDAMIQALLDLKKNLCPQYPNVFSYVNGFVAVNILPQYRPSKNISRIIIISDWRTIELGFSSCIDGEILPTPKET